MLTGSLLRLPAGLLADRFGGKKLFVVNTLLTALFSLALCLAHSYTALLALALGVGLAGASFAVGNSWIAQWVPVERRGLSLGTFGAGNAGASLTKLLAPLLIVALPASIPFIGGWRFVPFLIGLLLIACAALIQLSAPADKPVTTQRTLADWLRPLQFAQVWRFGLYYVVFFGAYVAMSLLLAQVLRGHLPGFFAGSGPADRPVHLPGQLAAAPGRLPLG